jgi:hypothetical protein
MDLVNSKNRPLIPYPPKKFKICLHPVQLAITLLLFLTILRFDPPGTRRRRSARDGTVVSSTLVKIGPRASIAGTGAVFGSRSSSARSPPCAGSASEEKRRFGGPQKYSGFSGKGGDKQESDFPQMKSSDSNCGCARKVETRDDCAKATSEQLEEAGSFGNVTWCPA